MQKLTDQNLMRCLEKKELNIMLVVKLNFSSD